MEGQRSALLDPKLVRTAIPRVLILILTTLQNKNYYNRCQEKVVAL